MQGSRDEQIEFLGNRGDGASGVSPCTQWTGARTAQYFSKAEFLLLGAFPGVDDLQRSAAVFSENAAHPSARRQVGEKADATAIRWRVSFHAAKVACLRSPR